MTKDKTKLRKLIDDAGIAAVELFDTENPNGPLQEQAFYIAGFQDCIKWLDLQNKLK